VILRVVGGQIRRGELVAVSRSFRTAFVPVAARTRGLRRYVVGTRPSEDGGHRLAAMTIWDDLDGALAAYGGELSTPRTLDGLDHGAHLDRVDYYEVEATRARADEREPTRLRLTAGTVARGLDADVQEELRARVPELPDEAIEAYVGRRVLGRVVEIAFMSTWTKEPPGLVLDAPIWPAISARYETFRMELHDVVVEGLGPAAREPGPG
jgi:hypothetical protein